MEFRFDPNQAYQLRAVDAVAGLFAGQPYQAASLDPVLAAVPNRLALTEAQILQNLRQVQNRNGLPQDGALLCMEAEIESASGPGMARFPNFSVEMETGTGKTYVYLRTALELHLRYGLRKFIVVVPSVAVREGVLKTLRVTEKHLKAMYGNLPYRYYVYDSERLAQVRQFALSDAVELMVMTLDAFNKAGNTIRQPSDRLQGETPLHLVQATHPVLILDEPQNMESELSVRALAALDPLCAFRYSATHRNPYHLIYRLTPYDAYRQRLVKRIEVAAVEARGDAGQPLVRLEGIRAQQRTVTARVSVHKQMRSGGIKEQSIVVRPRASLRALTGRTDYTGYEVEEISPGAGYLRFANGVELKTGEALGDARAAVMAAQIRYTIAEHFRKQSSLRCLGIKVLSLFFIDRVDHYAGDGPIRQIFDQAFNDLKAGDPEWAGADPAAVQAAYFARRAGRTGAAEWLDSVHGRTSRADEAVYDLIMRDKERLLSLDEPVAFIFSHSALREGWDNPNVFQICTLNQTTSEVKKRQEIGRGVRLAVNQSGERVHDDQVNRLTVVANESYESYVQKLQTEIESEYGTEGVPPRPDDARRRVRARLREDRLAQAAFQGLWQRLQHKPRFAVGLDTERLITQVVADLDRPEVGLSAVTVTRAEVLVGAEDRLGVTHTAAKPSGSLGGQRPVPDLLQAVGELLEHTTPRIRLTRRTLVEILRRARSTPAALHSPYQFASAAARAIRRRALDLMVDQVRFELTGECYSLSLFNDQIPGYTDHLVPSRRPDGAAGAALYDRVPCDSELEKRMVGALEGRADVILYFKLPGWYIIPTPAGDYHPGWAVVDDSPGGFTYHVIETSTATGPGGLPPDQRRKALCGRAYFSGVLGLDYRLVTDEQGLP